MLKDYLPKIDIFVELELEDIAEALLLYLNFLDTNNPNGNIVHNSKNIFGATSGPLYEYASEANQKNKRKIQLRLAEAWQWLISQGFLASDPSQMSASDWYFITSRGRDVAKSGNVKKYLHINLLPKTALDSNLLKKVYSDFIREDFESAVFKAFKEVEVRVRKKAKYPNKKYGVNLMREAFHSDIGILTDQSQEIAEKDATRDLFSGAIGLFKNPVSHRDVDYTDPNVAVGLILFANTLLKILDER